MTSSWKTYRVSFCVRDYYTVDLKARSEAEAEARASDLYDRSGEVPFTFDVSRGGTDEWEAEQLPTPTTNESNDHD
jgi:hypothetical protein